MTTLTVLGDEVGQGGVGGAGAAQDAVASGGRSRMPRESWASLPVHAATLEVLRRPVESAQYASVAFTAELLKQGMHGSIGTVGDALDNVLRESSIGLFKTEAINVGGPSWTDSRAVEWQVARWVHWCDRVRLHSSLGTCPRLSSNSVTGRLRA